MSFESVLITGGAGFVGSNLAMLFRTANPAIKVTALDNLKRRGSDLNVQRLAAAGVGFVHGDIRCPEDFHGVPDFDLLIDCSAEPSVQAGVGSSPLYVLQTNLTGTIHCLELARLRKAAFLFLSTSRVYSIAALNDLPFEETEARFRWTPDRNIPGFSEHGIAEEFSTTGARSFYGASKLGCEQIVQEYVLNYGMKALINRCGVLTGPWQMGKVDQGVMALWVACHYFQKPLRYMGFGGRGKQVRDLLHVADLFDLLQKQLREPDKWDGRIYNVGGGNPISVSLLELTKLCQEVSGRQIAIASVPETAAVDLRIFVTDSRRVQRDFQWTPSRDVRQVVRDIHDWIDRHADMLRPILG